MAKVGKKVAFVNAAYMVTKSSAKAKEVKLIKVKASAKKLSIPATININGYKYKVTALAANAATGSRKLTRVTIGSNIKMIGKAAFKNCKKLISVTINKNVTTIEKEAFRNCRAVYLIRFIEIV